MTERLETLEAIRQPTDVVQGTALDIARKGAAQLFEAPLARIETPLPPGLEKNLRASFDRSIQTWQELGVLTNAEFDEYVPSLTDHVDCMQRGQWNQPDKNYNMISFIPKLPLNDLVELLKTALRREFEHGRIDKPKNSLIIKIPYNNIIELAADQINLDEILWQWEGYVNQEMVHNPNALNPGKYHGIAESSLTNKNQGIVRLERPMPLLTLEGELSANEYGLSARKSLERLGGRTGIPPQVTFQNVYEGIAFLIQFLKTYHFLPVAVVDDYKEASQVLLCPGTYFPNHSSAGAVAALYFSLKDQQFRVDRYDAAMSAPSFTVVGGIELAKGE
jgi:hypothetical protein